MTKDGRPSLLNDIRYFYGRDRCSSPYLDGHEDAVAFGRRIAWHLNGQGVSLGAYPALYLLLTPALKPGTVEITNEGGDWWQRYTNIGVPDEFPNIADASNLVEQGTIRALNAIRPDLCDVIEHSAFVAKKQAENLRFLLKTRLTKRFLVEVSSTISEWPAPSLLYVAFTNKSDGSYYECPPTPLKFYIDAIQLAGKITVTEAEVRLLPKTSLCAQMTAARCCTPGGFFSEFHPVTARPVYSGLIKWRG